MDDKQSVAATLHTIRDFVRWAISQFEAHELHYGHGTADALSEARYLLLQALHLPFEIGDDYLDCQLLMGERWQLIERIRRRVEERIPAPYLTGEAFFAGLRFEVNPHVLIPRSPIAELIEAEFHPWIASPEAVGAILDIGTGSGCIAIACAYAFPDAQVDAIDLDREALAVAERNIAAHSLKERVHAVQSDLFANVDRRYDLIVSNPPYVGQEELENLPPEYRHEPRLALAAGSDGLDIVLELLRQAPDYMSEEAILIVEVGSAAEALTLTLPELPLIWLELARGGEGLFTIDRPALLAHHDAIVTTLQQRTLVG